MYDVAREAGVSQTTVTHVLTGKRPVSAATKERVWDAITRLDFHPNEMARALRRQRSHSVALVLPNIVHALAPVFARHAGVRLREHGFQVTIHETDGDPETAASIVGALASWPVDGAIFSGFALGPDSAEALHRRQIPFVNCGVDDEEVRPWPVVRLDQGEGMRQVLEVLAERTAGAIAYVGGPAGAPGADIRRRAYEREMARLGRPVDERLIASVAYDWRAGRQAARSLLGTGLPFGAVACANDLIAIGVCAELRGRGIAIPDDVAVTGFDNIEPDAMVEPTLTSVETHMDRIAQEGVDLLLAAMGGQEDLAANVLVQPQLVRRASA
ncbi:LacI family DNA-binding transcriptional regulator [Kineococcus glutinatus]|uniref:LacI family DNA-binding transcriptional regulator n=1 Tax=Kineococcus glutinatus TaxID=1070872 RepID=A0ABP9HDR1_9ACTN